MKQYLGWFELSLRIYVWSKMWVYGLGKIVGGQFYRKGSIPKEIADQTLATVGSYDLAWTFFGHSQMYIWCIGGAQVLGGLLLLFRKTTLLGLFILIPILLNIIAVDIFYGVARGALFSAVLYLSMCLYIAYYNRKQLSAAIKELMRSNKSSFTKKEILIAIVAIGIIQLGLTLAEVFFINQFGRYE